MQELERRLGLFSVVTISISSMIGSGIFVLPGIGFNITGPSVYLAFLVAAFCILPAAISKAELATAMPTSGGTYVYLERTFGPLAGTISGLGLFLSILLKASFSLVGIGAYFSILSSFALIPTILTFLVIICLLNLLGIGKVSSFLTFILFVTIVSLLILCLFSFSTWDAANLAPVLPNGLKGLAAATALVFVSYAGVTKVAAIAEEIKDPEQNLPKGILLSLFFVTILYCGVSFVLAGNFHHTELAGELRPIYVLAEKVGGKSIGAFFALIAVLTMVNTANAGVLAGSRFPFAMARDKLLPSFLGKLHPKFLTPTSSIILSALIIVAVLLTMNIAKIAKLASSFMIMIYVLESVAVIVLRETRTQWYKPSYKSPLYPYLQILGIISGLALLTSMGMMAIYAVVFTAIPGFLLYIFYSRKKITRRGVIGIRGKRSDLIEDNEEERNVSASKYRSVTMDGDAKVIIALFGKERSPEMLIEMGIAMAEHGNLEVAHILEIPEQATLGDFSEETSELKSLRRRVYAMAADKNEPLTFDRIVSHDISKTIYEIGQHLHSQWILMEYTGKHRGSFTFHSPIGWLKSHLDCNLATFRDSGVRYIRKIMAVLNNDKNDALVLETANHLATVNKADVTLIEFSISSSTDIEREEALGRIKMRSSDITVASNSKLIIGEDEVKSILDETADFDLLILGSADHSFKNSIFGSKDDQIIAKAACSVIAVHSSVL